MYSHILAWFGKLTVLGSIGIVLLSLLVENWSSSCSLLFLSWILKRICSCWCNRTSIQVSVWWVPSGAFIHSTNSLRIQLLYTNGENKNMDSLVGFTSSSCKVLLIFWHFSIYFYIYDSIFLILYHSKHTYTDQPWYSDISCVYLHTVYLISKNQVNIGEEYASMPPCSRVVG